MKKWIRFLAVLLVLTALLGTGVKLYYDYWHDTYIMLNEQKTRRDVTELDYRGAVLPEMEKLAELKVLEVLDLRETGLTAEEYDYISGLLPECRILWSVPFRGEYLSEETTELTVDDLRPEDFMELSYLPKLERLYLVNCGDVEVIGALKAAMPDIEVFYSVTLDGQEYSESTTELTVDDLRLEDFMELSYLPKLEKLYLANCSDADVISALKEARPEIEVFYSITLNGQEYSESTTEVTLENVDAQELDRALPYLFELKQVNFTGNVPDKEQIYEWMVSYPDVSFSWNFKILGVLVNSLDTQIILSGIRMESVDAIEAELKYFRNLQRVEMCKCGIPSEEMDALGKRHPDIRFVWTVYVGKCELRTDITTFMPYKYGHKGDELLTDRDTAELKYCTDIICMDLGHMIIGDYSFLENMTKMQYLVLADTKGSDFSVLVNLTELVFLELFITRFDQPEVLTGMTKLEDLNLAYTPIDNIEPLKEMKSLKRLWMVVTENVDDEEMEQLREALPDTLVFDFGTGSTDFGWRQGQRYYEMRDLLGMHYMM